MKNRCGKSIISFLTAAVILSTVTATAAGAELRLNGELIQLQNEPYIENGTTLIPVSEIFSLLGVSFDWDEYTKTVTAKKDDITMVFTIGTSFVLVNGNSISSPVPSKVVNNVSYVPLRIAAETFGANVSWDADTKTVVIENNSENVPVEESTVDNITPDGDIASKVLWNYDTDLTYDEAYTKAVSHNTDLKTLSASLKLMEDSRDRVGQYVTNYAFATVDNPYITTSANYAMLSSLNSIDSSIKSNPYNKQIVQDGVELSIKSSFSSIIQLKIQAALLNDTTKVTKEALENQALLLELGMISKTDYDKSSLEYDKLLESIKAVNESIEAEYIALNNLMGQKAENRYNIEYDFSYETYPEIADLDNFILKKIAVAPTVKLKEIAVTDAEIALNLYSLTDTESYMTKEYKLGEASRALVTTRDNIDKYIRSAVSQIRNIETNIKSQEFDLSQAKSDYETMLVRYDTGLITKLQLDQSKLAISSAENALEQSKHAHYIYKYMIEKPYLGA